MPTSGGKSKFSAYPDKASVIFEKSGKLKTRKRISRKIREQNRDERVIFANARAKYTYKGVKWNTCKL